MRDAAVEHPAVLGIEEVGRGLAGRLHLLCCRIARLASGLLLRGRGLQTACWLLGRVFGRKNHVTFRVFDGHRLRIPLSDGYWMAPLLRERDYEPRVRHVLSMALDDPEVAFVDCGANIGWWSLYASTRITDPRRIIAIEASSERFSRLRENASLNGEPFSCVHAAVWSRSGAELEIETHPEHHAGGSVMQGSRHRWQGQYVKEGVLSVTLDDLARRFLGSESDRLVVKLDIEGAELEALRGARQMLSEDVLLVFEDHVEGGVFVVTSRLLEQGFRVFGCDASYRISEIQKSAGLSGDEGSQDNRFAAREGTGYGALLGNMASRS
jgi:FkbM family methyltransferase